MKRIGKWLQKRQVKTYRFWDIPEEDQSTEDEQGEESMIELVTVRYIGFPDIEDGVSGFYEKQPFRKCAEPHKPYSSAGVRQNGWCHTDGDELDELAVQVGFVTREEFRRIHGSKSWKQAYGEKLSRQVGAALQEGGIRMTITGRPVLFRCPKGEFVTWPSSRHVSS